MVFPILVAQRRWGKRNLRLRSVSQFDLDTILTPRTQRGSMSCAIRLLKKHDEAQHRRFRLRRERPILCPAAANRPRIAALVHAALGPARTVLNVGAGAGSYEPADRHVIAIEPSAAMRAQ